MTTTNCQVRLKSFRLSDCYSIHCIKKNTPFLHRHDIHSRFAASDASFYLAGFFAGALKQLPGFLPFKLFSEGQLFAKLKKSGKKVVFLFLFFFLFLKNMMLFNNDFKSNCFPFPLFLCLFLETKLRVKTRRIHSLCCYDKHDKVICKRKYRIQVDKEQYSEHRKTLVIFLIERSDNNSCLEEKLISKKVIYIRFGSESMKLMEVLS